MDSMATLLTALVDVDPDIHYEYIRTEICTSLKLHKQWSNLVLRYTPPSFVVLTFTHANRGLSLEVFTYTEEVLENRNFSPEEVMTDATVGGILELLNAFPRPCIGIKEEEVITSSLDRILIEKMRGALVYRSRQCLRIIKDDLEQTSDELAVQKDRCSACLCLFDTDVKQEDSVVQQDYQPPDGHHPDQAEDAVLFEKLEHYGIREEFYEPEPEEEEEFEGEKEDYTDVKKENKRRQWKICSMEYCNKKFKTLKSLNKHKQVVHSDTPVFSCPVSACLKEFAEPMDRKMMAHLARAHPNDQKARILLESHVSIKCKTCEDVQGSLLELREHERNCRQSATCELCGQVYSSASTLKVHKRTNHSDECFVCQEPDCRKRLKTKASLLDHMSSVHRNEKLYVCHGCGKNFKYRHQRRMCENKHVGKFIHPCTLCDKKFNDKRRFQQHMRVHTGEKPFMCPICNFRCARMDNLNLHTKKAHGVTCKEAEGMTGISCNRTQAVTLLPGQTLTNLQDSSDKLQINSDQTIENAFTVILQPLKQ